MSRPSRRLLGMLLALALLLVAAAPARAAEPVTVELQTEPDVKLGDTVTVQIAVKDSQGGPVSGATVVLLTPASLGSARGEMRLGQVTTNSQGRATFAYEARSEGTQTLIARFPGSASYAPAEASAPLRVLGSAQLYQQEAGVQVPWIGVWILVLLLGAFWSVYLVVMVLVTLIARAGEKATPPVGGGRG